MGNTHSGEVECDGNLLQIESERASASQAVRRAETSGRGKKEATPVDVPIFPGNLNSFFLLRNARSSLVKKEQEAALMKPL